MFKAIRISTCLISIFLVSCGQEKSDGTVFYLPVWEECSDEFENFYQGDKNTKIEFYPFPESKYMHPRLLGIMKVSKSYSNATEFYPSVSCLSDHRTTVEYSSPVAMRVIEDMVSKVQSSNKPNLAYMVFDKDSYSIYWSERK